MEFPNRIVKEGETDRAVVKALRAELKRHGISSADPDGVFGPHTKNAVMLFQTRNVDSAGTPLLRDGKVGSLTWHALFGTTAPAPVTAPATAFLGKVLEKARSQVGVLEVPRNSNSGPEVNAYLSRAGVPLGLPASKKPWCCAFVYWCFDETAKAERRSNPMVRTAGCLDHWNRAAAAGGQRTAGRAAVANPSLVRPGMIFIIESGGGFGHTGLVSQVRGGTIDTIEGNTDASQTREGGGVYTLTRKLADINKGFILYA